MSFRLCFNYNLKEQHNLQLQNSSISTMEKHLSKYFLLPEFCYYTPSQKFHAVLRKARGRTKAIYQRQEKVVRILEADNAEACNIRGVAEGHTFQECSGFRSAKNARGLGKHCTELPRWSTHMCVQ